MRGRVDSNDPKKVIICHSTGHYNMINSRSVFLVLCGNACHDGVNLRSLKMPSVMYTPPSVMACCVICTTVSVPEEL